MILNFSVFHRTSPVWFCRFSIGYGRLNICWFIGMLSFKGWIIKSSFRMRAFWFTSLFQFISWFFFFGDRVFWRIGDPSFLAGSGFGPANRIKKELISCSKDVGHIERKGFS